MFFFHVLTLAMKTVLFFEPIKHIEIEIDWILAMALWYSGQLRVSLKHFQMACIT